MSALLVAHIAIFVLSAVNSIGLIYLIIKIFKKGGGRG